MKALVIEDDSDIVESVSQVLHMRWPSGNIQSTHLGRRGIELAEKNPPDFIILDIGLPDIDGMEVLERIRSFSSVPVIILSASWEESSIVKGLELGADDYIVKPCGHLELLARVKARVHDEVSNDEDAPTTYGPINFDPLSRQLVYDAKTIDLTAIEARIIHHLIRNAGQVSTYSSIANSVWGDYYPGSVDSLRVHIRRMRKKIEADPDNPRLIITKAGMGYFLRELTSKRWG